MKKLIIIFAVIILSSCSSSGDSTLDTKDHAMMMGENSGDSAATSVLPQSKEETSAKDPDKINSNRKLILRYNLRYDTKEYDKAVKFIDNLIREYQGYQIYADEYSYDSRDLSITVMIPTDRVENFIADLDNEESLNFLNKNLNSEDVTDQYTDTELRLKILREKLDRLQNLAREKSSLEELLQLEKEISSTIYEIESIEGALRVIDSKINYTEVSINVSEITTQGSHSPSKIPFGEKLGQAFKDSTSNFIEGIQNVILFIVYIIPYLLIIAIIIAVLYYPAKPLRKKLKERRAAKTQERAKERAKKTKENYNNSAYKVDTENKNNDKK